MVLIEVNQERWPWLPDKTRRPDQRHRIFRPKDHDALPELLRLRDTNRQSEEQAP